MLQPAEFFGEQPLALVYIAKRLSEALALEKLLTGANIDYLIETDTYRGGLIFQSERVGAFFYVVPAIEEQVRELMQGTRFKPYEPLGGRPSPQDTDRTE